MAPKLTVLLIEDNPLDRRLAREALTENGACRVEEIGEGDLALLRLKRQAQYRGAERPSLVILDLNLPKLSGLEILSKMRADPELRATPVVVMSTSRAESDLEAAYHGYANCFVTKPFDFDEYQEYIRKVRDFWLQTSTIPSIV